MRNLLFLTWPLIFLGLAVNAEPVWQVQSDLNNDGNAESFTLYEMPEHQINLRITENGETLLEVEDFVWQGGLFGQIPELEVAANGSVQVISMNEGCCRHRWSQTVTIAYRKGAYRVAGITYIWRDTLDLEDWGICDVNLLNGRGTLTKGDLPARAIRAKGYAPKVLDWSVSSDLPDACKLE